MNQALCMRPPRKHGHKSAPILSTDGRRGVKYGGRLVPSLRSLGLGVAILALTSLPGCNTSHAETPPWTAYFGTQDRVATWTNLVRGIGRGRTGIALSRLPLDSLADVPGFAFLLGEIEQVIATRDLIIPVGGLGSGITKARIDGYMEVLKPNDATRWSELVYAQAMAVGRLPNARDRVYWQIGNEINTKKMGQALRRVSGDPG